MIFKPRSPNKYTGVHQDNSSQFTSNAFNALQHDQRGTEHNYPISTEEVIKNMSWPNEPDNIESVEGINKNFSIITDQEKQLNSSTDIKIPDMDVQHGVMASEMVQGISSNNETFLQKEVILEQVLTSNSKDQHSVNPTMEISHDSSQEIEDEDRVIHFEDEVKDSKLEHMRDINDNLNDVFNPGDQEDYAMEVNQLASKQGLSPRDFAQS
ncbi:hypothetical protein FXO37_16040 [Capsicum annuum]|nr:hypothetical protein FXO37_16040 [Capsicum annuum]